MKAEEIITIEQVLVLLDECKTGNQEAELIHQYARLQIEKDRERVKKSFLKTMAMGSEQIVDQTPIILD